MHDSPETSDARTLAFYDREAAAYAGRRLPKRSVRLERFVGEMPSGAAVMDLGCGGGQDSEVMLQAGLRVAAIDGSPGLAREAERRLGRPVQVLRFEDLDAVDSYDGVWANASLLHVAIEALPDVLARVWRSLRPGGLLFASFKAGDAPGRDAIGRYFNFTNREELEALFRQAAAWSELTIDEGPGGGYDGVQRTWLMTWARRR
ncbi:MAG: methyltransferase domain-containing protein [Caulobacter sp.]|nr:methyltransferase domain-containing protein [Caulobacter sp.]